MTALELARDHHYLERIPAMADQFANSNLCPEQFRGKPADVAVIAYSLASLDVRLSFPVLAQCYVVNGRPGLMAELQQSLAARAQVRIVPIAERCTPESATVQVRMPTGEVHEVTFTMEEAKTAGLADKKGEMYTKWPTNMLKARATTRAISWYCPQVKLGMVDAGVVDVDEMAEVDAATDPDDGEWPARIPPRSVAPNGATIPIHLREPEVDDDVRAQLIARLEQLQGQGAAAFDQVREACKELGIPNLRTHRFTKAHGALMLRLINEATAPAGPGQKDEGATEGQPFSAQPTRQPAPGPAEPTSTPAASPAPLQPEPPASATSPERTPVEVVDDAPEARGMFDDDDPGRPF